jgi:hypothetical protein
VLCVCWQIARCFAQLFFWHSEDCGGGSAMRFDGDEVATHAVLGGHAAAAEAEAGPGGVLDGLALLAQAVSA